MKRPSLVRQIQLNLTDQLKLGESKHAAKIVKGTHSPEGIFSYSTMDSYMKHCNEFGSWAKEAHGLKYIDQGKELVEEYLQQRLDQGISASTLKLDRCALAKLYKCSGADFKIELPARIRSDIKRSRTPEKNGFSEKLNKEIADFCKGVGLRRSELEFIKGRDIIHLDEGRYYLTKDKQNEIHIHDVPENASMPKLNSFEVKEGSYAKIVGKGGKPRISMILPQFEKMIINKAKSVGPSDVIFKSDEIKTRMDVHSYRRQYTQAYYDSVARDLSQLERSEKYFCRKDKAGTVYDKRAMLEVSKALGHNRISVIAGHYLD